MNAKRGYVPEDDSYFNAEALEIMRKASGHVCYLINEGYGLKQATVFVGNHFLLSERQRLAVMRSVATEEQLFRREKKKISLDDIAGKRVWVDGFNTIITLEVMLSGSLLFLGMDGTIRDLAALRGTYRLIPETTAAVKMMLDILMTAKVSSAVILLDEPVSNSGRLKARIADLGEDYPFALDILIQKDVDKTLYQQEYVITSDSIVLDQCRSWVNLTGECLKRTDAEALRVFGCITEANSPLM